MIKQFCRYTLLLILAGHLNACYIVQTQPGSTITVQSAGNP